MCVSDHFLQRCSHFATYLVSTVPLICPGVAPGFPLTDAQLGRSFAVVTGHAANEVNWHAFKDIPTVVVLMGGRSLPFIVGGLIAAGKAPGTPVSTMVPYRWQRVIHGALHVCL